MGLPYQLEHVASPARKQPGYLDLNPLGTVPTFFDGDLRMTESTAVPLYLATRYGPSDLAVAPDEGDAYGEFLNFNTYGEATLTFPQTIYIRYTLQEPEKGLGAAAKDYKYWFIARLRLLESVIDEREFVCAERFTVADISVSYACKLAEYLGYGDEMPEVVKNYWSRMKNRDGYQRAMAAQLNK